LVPADLVRSLFGGIGRGDLKRVFGEQIWEDDIFRSMDIVSAFGVCHDFLHFEMSLVGGVDVDIFKEMRKIPDDPVIQTEKEYKILMPSKYKGASIYVEPGSLPAVVFVGELFVEKHYILRRRFI
jgi:hypothetical protein